MSLFHLEHSIALWRRSRESNRAFTADDLDELEQHLRDQVKGLVTEGKSEEEAFRTALQEMGDYGTAEQEYKKVYWRKLGHRQQIVPEVGYRIDMMANYFRIAWRNLLKNRLSSLISISGLAVGLATGIVIWLMISSEFRYDRFHTNLSDIYLLMINQKEASAVSTGKATPGPLAERLRTGLPEVRESFRTSFSNPLLFRYGEDDFFENSLFADPELFKVMTFPAVQGNPEAALRDARSIVISERTARKLFGDENPIGKTLVYNNDRDVRVGAVIRDVSPYSSLQFDVVLPFKFFERENTDWIDRWDNNRLQTWVQLQPGIHPAHLEAKLKDLLQKNSDDTSQELFAYPLKDLRLYGRFENGKPVGGNIDIVFLIGLVGLFVLLVACINFMNLSTARSERRAREVGVRKVLGASRRLITMQFMSEAVLTTLLALVLGIGLAVLALPLFSRFYEQPLSFELSNRYLLPGLFGMGLFTAFVAGSYPSLFLARFLPVTVLKGPVSTGKKGSLLRQILVTVQFVVSIFLIVSTLVISKQIEFVQDRPVGYRQENLVDIPIKGDVADQYRVLKNELAKVPNVVSVSAGSHDMVRIGGMVHGMEWPGKTEGQDFGVALTWVQYDWTKTVGVSLTAGRDFSADFGSDTTACLLNRTAVRMMRLADPIGAVVGSKTVIGVIDDFVFNNPSSNVSPTMVMLNPRVTSHILVRLEDRGDRNRTLASIERIVKRINPGFPFEYQLIKDRYEKSFDDMRSIGRMTGLFCGMAIFISCLGLFGLSAFMAERRTKEIGIRKVLGASIRAIWYSLSMGFLKPVVVAFILTVPISAWAMHLLLQEMDYHMPLSAWLFVLSGLFVLGIALFTVSFQGVRAALADPVKSLRYE